MKLISTYNLNIMNVHHRIGKCGRCELFCSTYFECGSSLIIGEIDIQWNVLLLRVKYAYVNNRKRPVQPITPLESYSNERKWAKR